MQKIWHPILHATKVCFTIKFTQRKLTEMHWYYNTTVPLLNAIKMLKIQNESVKIL